MNNSLTEDDQMDDYTFDSSYYIVEAVRLFIKIAAGNLIPFLWLFFLQSFFGIRFDGAAFWVIYAMYTIVLAVGVWLANKQLPSPGIGEIPSPIYGLIVATFPLIIYMVMLIVYKQV